MKRGIGLLVGGGLVLLGAVAVIFRSTLSGVQTGGIVAVLAVLAAASVPCALHCFRQAAERGGVRVRAHVSKGQVTGEPSEHVIIRAINTGSLAGEVEEFLVQRKGAKEHVDIPWGAVSWPGGLNKTLEHGIERRFAIPLDTIVNKLCLKGKALPSKARVILLTKTEEEHYSNFVVIPPV